MRRVISDANQDMKCGIRDKAQGATRSEPCILAPLWDEMSPACVGAAFLLASGTPLLYSVAVSLFTLQHLAIS